MYCKRNKKTFRAFEIVFVGLIGNEPAMKLNDAELIGRLLLDKGPLKHKNKS
jgi:hypothetical protein